MMPRRTSGSAKRASLEAAAEGVAVDRGDDRQRQLHQRHEAALEELVLHLPRGLRHAVALLEIGAGAEGALAGAGEHHAAGFARLGRQPGPELVELAPHLRVEGVERLGAVQRDEQQMRLPDLEGQGLVVHEMSSRLSHA
jgi:hypothetical protein